MYIRCIKVEKSILQKSGRQRESCRLEISEQEKHRRVKWSSCTFTDREKDKLRHDDCYLRAVSCAHDIRLTAVTRMLESSVYFQPTDIHVGYYCLEAKRCTIL